MVLLFALDPSLYISATVASSKSAGSHFPESSGLSLPPLGAIHSSVPPAESIFCILDSVILFCFILSGLVLGSSSMYFFECTHSRFLPIEKGLHSGSLTTLSPAT